MLSCLTTGVTSHGLKREPLLGLAGPMISGPLASAELKWVEIHQDLRMLTDADLSRASVLDSQWLGHGQF